MAHLKSDSFYLGLMRCYLEKMAALLANQNVYY